MRKPHKLLSSQRGFTIVEALIGFVILGTACFSFILGVVSLRDVVKKTNVTSTYDKQINEICSNIKAGVENYQIDFNFDNSNGDDPLPVESLPMAWDMDVVSTKEKCPWCQGSFGYSIRPLETMRGLYSVNVRFTHKKWGDFRRDFSFVVSVK